MSKLTDQWLEEIRAADAARTPGEWKIGDIAHPKGVVGPHCKQAITAGTHHTIAQTFHGQWRRDFDTPERIDDPDAEFIAMCSTAIPELLAHITTLESANQRMREALEPFAAEWERKRQRLMGELMSDDKTAPGHIGLMIPVQAYINARAALAEGEKGEDDDEA